MVGPLITNGVSTKKARETHRILSDMIKKEKDIYFYDDTHWTMKGAEAMSESIYNMIQNKKAVE